MSRYFFFVFNGSKSVKISRRAELGFNILLLPPISRGAHLDGPLLHAQRVVELWQLDSNDDIPLAQAFRLLDVETIAGAILRTLVAADDYPSDPRHFPPLKDLLPELREISWQAMLAEALLVEGIKGVRGTRHRAVPPAELPRRTPDWELSRLIRGADDEFIEVRVRPATAEPVKKTWRRKPTKADVAAAMKHVAADYPPGAQPSEKQTWAALEYELTEEITRTQVRGAIKNHAPQLRGRRGHRSKGKSPE